jgi:hypothetical protein
MDHVSRRLAESYLRDGQRSVAMMTFRQTAIGVSFFLAVWFAASPNSFAADCSSETDCRQSCDQRADDLNEETTGNTHWTCNLGPPITVPANPQEENSQQHTTYECLCVQRPGASDDDGNDDDDDDGGWTNGHWTRKPPLFPGGAGSGSYPPGWTYDECKVAADAAHQENVWATCFGKGSPVTGSGDLSSPIWGAGPKEVRKKIIGHLDRCLAQVEKEHKAALAYCEQRYGGK